MSVSAHPAPNSLILMDIHPKGISIELQLPLIELQAAMGINLTEKPERTMSQYGEQLQNYLKAHIHLISDDARAWKITFGKMVILDEQKNFVIGVSRNLDVQLWCEPPIDASHRKFTLKYDAIIHQVITHNALVSIRQDWENGIHAIEPVQVGVICLDIPKNSIPPFQVNLQDGSETKGFKSMVLLGEKHIAEGADHLLFLLTLLLVAPLTINSKQWGNFGGTRYSFVRLLKIITAFTFGHSLTLLLGALGWIHLPSRPIEILIAFSIVISAVHALKPIFFGKEIYIAIGFGLIHGLAFAGTLANLQLSPQYLVLSILGFNIGIELMQLLIVTLIMPLLIILSKTPIYNYARVLGASFALIAATAWMFERVLNTPNVITEFLKILVFKF